MEPSTKPCCLHEDSDNLLSKTGCLFEVLELQFREQKSECVLLWRGSYNSFKDEKEEV